jgi:hypothetical protein
LRAVAFIHEEETGLLFRGESDGIAFADIKEHMREESAGDWRGTTRSQ